MLVACGYYAVIFVAYGIRKYNSLVGNFNGGFIENEFRALYLGVFFLFAACGKSVAADGDFHAFRTPAQCGARGVHSHVSGADYDYAVAELVHFGTFEVMHSVMNVTKRFPLNA